MADPLIDFAGYGLPLTATMPTMTLINIERPSCLGPRSFVTGMCAPTSRSLYLSNYLCLALYRLSYGSGCLIYCENSDTLTDVPASHSLRCTAGRWSTFSYRTPPHGVQRSTD